MEFGSTRVSDDFAHALWAGLATVAYLPQEHTLLQQHSGFEPSLLTVMDAPCDKSLPLPDTSMPDPTPLACWPTMPTYQSISYEAEYSVDPATTSLSPSPPMPRDGDKFAARPNPRRRLTDEDRRQICLYHEKNRTAKQIELAG